MRQGLVLLQHPLPSPDLSATPLALHLTKFRMVVNQMAVKKTGVAFQQVTEPTAEKRAITHAVELDEEAFHKGWTGVGV